MPRTIFLYNWSGRGVQVLTYPDPKRNTNRHANCDLQQTWQFWVHHVDRMGEDSMRS
jgi:hypothetical protein